MTFAPSSMIFDILYTKGCQLELTSIDVLTGFESIMRQPASAVVEKFRKKYGARDIKKYFSKFDVAVERVL